MDLTGSGYSPMAGVYDQSTDLSGWGGGGSIKQEMF